jgi:hypothetical protein
MVTFIPNPLFKRQWGNVKGQVLLEFTKDYTGEVIKEMERSTPGPSAEGKAPAIATGASRSAIAIWKVNDNRVDVVLRSVRNPINGVSVSEYAHYLEFGTRRMAARPVWRRVLHSKGRQLARQALRRVK